MISNEFKLCCDREIGFGHVVSYKIHYFNGGSNLAFSHYGGTEKKNKKLQICVDFQKLNVATKKSLSFTFYGGSTRHGGKA
jgi:hypothetical protein